MAPPLPILVVSPLLLLCIPHLFIVSAHLDLDLDDPSSSAADASLKFMSDAAEWPIATALNPFLYDGVFDEDDSVDVDGSAELDRRSLFWRRVHFYISYAAMSANRVPCRPRSGWSYYTHNCRWLSGPVHPYFRSCSAITRCRR